MNQQLIVNNFASVLAQALTAAATTATLSAGAGAKLPALTNGDYVEGTLTQSTAAAGSSETSWELVRITAVAGDVVTIVRPTDGTAAAWKAGDKFEVRISARLMSNLIVGSATEFRPDVNFKADSICIYAGAQYKFKVDHPAGQWTGADVTFLRQMRGEINTIGLMKIQGNQAWYSIGSVLTAPIARLSRRIKFQMEGLAYSLRVRVYNKEPQSGMSTVRCSFAPTDSATVTAADLAGTITPTVAGVTHNVLASTGDPLGFNPVTWGGAPQSGFVHPGGCTASGRGAETDTNYIDSDEIPIITVAPTTGVRPLGILAYNHDSNIGESESNAGVSYVVNEYTKYVGGAGRLFYCPSLATTADIVTDPTVAMGATTGYDPTTGGAWPNIGLFLDHRIPVRNFGAFGDSITEAYNWWQDAVRALSTPQAPCYAVNFGASSMIADQYLATLRTQLRATPELTDILLPSFSSNNFSDARVTDAYIAGIEATLLAHIRMCKKAGKRVYVWLTYAGLTGTFATATTKSRILALNQRLRDNAVKGGYRIIDIEAGWINATMLNTTDGTHPNPAVGQPYMKGVALAAFQGE